MDDLISRQAAIASAISGRVRTLPTSEDGEDWIRTSEVRESLLNLPSAEPEPRWIPVTERLPEECGDYLITKETIGWNMLTCRTIDISYFDSGFVWHKPKVLAWMPLPEPYTED